MNLFKRNLLTVALLAGLASPAAVLADEVSVPAAASGEEATATPAQRMELMSTMRARMHEILRTQDPAERTALLEAQAKDMDNLLSMGGPPMGRKMGPRGTGMADDCNMANGRGMGMGMMRHGNMNDDDWSRHDAGTNQRLEALENRMDMMQTVLRMMLTH